MRDILLRFIGDKTFYMRASRQIIPIIIQSFVTSLSGFSDTIMASYFDGVSAVGTALQVDSLMQSVTFGIASGVNIFVVQYFGAKDIYNMKRSFALSLLLVSSNALLWMLISIVFNVNLLGLFISDADVAAQSFTYLKYSCFSFIFTSTIMSFSFAYHSVQKTVVPFIIGAITLVFHVILNYFLMFILGMGIEGAGLCMIVTQMFSLILYILYSVKTNQPFIGGFKYFKELDLSFIKKVIRKIYPLIMNETLFGFGNSMFIAAYGRFGKSVMDCYYIGNQVVNIAYTVVNGVSDGATTLIGYELGRKNFDFVEKEVNYFFGLTAFMSVLTIVFLLVFAPGIASLFAIASQESFNLAVSIIQVLSLRVAFRLFNVIIFAALRSGGDSKFLAFLDSGILWIFGIGTTYLLIYGLNVSNIVIVILISQIEQLVRLIIGLARINSKKWIKSLS